MSVAYRSRSQLVLAKLQSAEDAEATPTPSANAIRVVAPRFTPNLESVSTDDQVTNSLSVPAPIQAGGNGGMQFNVYACGVTSPGTNAPEYGPLIRACAMSETLTAAAVTGTAQAGGASTITLASGASSTDDAYKGMPVDLTGGTGDGLRNVIVGYNGTTKVATVAVPWANLPDGAAPDNTTTYSIPANALYKPVTSGLEYLTIWAYQHNNSAAADSRRRRIFDAQGTFNFQVAPRQPGLFNFTFTGELPDIPDSVARPSAPTYSSIDPEVLLSGDVYLGGAAAKFNAFSFAMGNSVAMFDDPSSAFGYDSAQVGMRKVTGTLNPNLVLLSSRDAFADWKNGVERSLWLRWGSAAGKRVSVLFPRLRYTGNEEGDVRGFVTEGLPFQAVGNDAEVYYCVH